MVIYKYIVHVLDKSSEGPILNDFEVKMSKDIDGFFSKLINKAKKDDNARKALFRNYNDNIVKNCCEQIIYDDSTFVANSKEIAAYLFDIIKNNENEESCDLAVCLFAEKDEKYVGLIKLDYKKTYTHSIELADDKFKIQIVSNEVGIPQTGSIKQCAIIGVNGINDEYHFHMLDKDAEKVADKKSAFIDEFLNAERVVDDKYNTRVFKTIADNFITNALGSDLKKAEDARSILNYMLKEYDEIDVNEFIESAVDDESIIESFKDLVSERELSENFGVDKDWVKKKSVKRNIKVDTGFEVKGRTEDFEDPMKYRLVENKENGTYDLIIKNITIIQG